MSNYAYAYIDNLSINTITNCHKPSALTVSNIDLTSATLSWTEGNDETEWDIEYGPVGFTHGNGTIVHASGIPYDLIDLTANTPYDVYVRADCGDGEVSDWAITPTTFTTLSCNAEEQCEYTLRLFRSEHLGNERWSHHGGSAGIQQRHQHPAHLDVG